MANTKKPTAKAGPKRKITTRKAAPTAPTEKVTAQKASKTQVNPHLEAGLDAGRYNGPSSYVNGNRKPQIMLKDGVSPEKLTDRAKSGLYALRDSYGNKTFQPRGFDNGILRDLVAAKLITVSGGQKVTLNGKPYMIDGESPVALKVTAAGANFGKA